MQIIALLIDQELRVTDDVDEKDVPNLEPNLFLNFGGHSGTDPNYANLIICSRCECRERMAEIITQFRPEWAAKFRLSGKASPRSRNRVEGRGLNGLDQSLFIDIVGYSKLLINEQSEQMEKLREIVRGTEQFRTAQAQGKSGRSSLNVRSN
jgi:hypothetical protein